MEGCISLRGCKCKATAFIVYYGAPRRATAPHIVANKGQGEPCFMGASGETWTRSRSHVVA
jgi:hypothetical protein